MPHQDAERKRLRDRVVETSIALHQVVEQGRDTREANGAHADAVRALLAWENRPAVRVQAQVQQLVDKLAQDLDLHIGHPLLERAYVRAMLKDAHTAVLAISSAINPHLAAVRALAAVEKTGLQWEGSPPAGGRSGYAARLNAIIEATAPAPPHRFQMVTLPVHFYRTNTARRSWEAAVCIGGAWYTRRCKEPDKVEELGPVVKDRLSKPAAAPWLENTRFTPDARDDVRDLPVEFPLMVTRLGSEWEGWRTWVPAPAQEERSASDGR